MLTDSGNDNFMVNHMFNETRITKSAPTSLKSEEQIVLDAEHFAIYRDTLVVKVPAMVDSAFSYGIIFAGNEIDEKNTAS